MTSDTTALPTPMEDRAFLRELPADDGNVLTPGLKEAGFQLAGHEDGMMARRGVVVAVGPGKRSGDVIAPPEVSVGDTVIFNRYGATDIEVGGEDLLLVRGYDLIAVVVDDEAAA